MADRSLVLPLDPPIEHNGGKVTELRLREPTGAEQRDAEKKLDGGMTPEAISSFQVALIGAVAGLPVDVLDALPVTAMHRAHMFVRGFDVTSPISETDAPSLDVPLPEPMTIDGVSYTAISVAEPTVGMRRKAEGTLRTGNTTANVRQYQLVLVAQASGIPFATVEKMPISALNDAEAFLRGFIEPGRRTGSA